MKRKRAFEKLQSALIENKRVLVRRVFDNADVVEGYVVAIGDDWVLLWAVDNNLAMDGWAALRIRDLFSVQKASERGDDVQRRVMEAANEWPPRAPAICNVSDLPSILHMADVSAPLLALHREAARPDAFVVGKSTAGDEKHITLEDLSSYGRWNGTRVLDTDDVTRVEFGTIYLQRLALAMEPYIG